MIDELTKAYEELQRKSNVFVDQRPFNAATFKLIMEEFPRRFEKPHVIGIGGRGIVVTADDLETGSRNAVKITLKGEGIQDEYIQHLKNLITRLPQPSENLLLPLAIIEGRIAVYEVYPFLAQVNDLGYKAQRTSFTPSEYLEIAAQVATGLCQLHRQGIIHGDVKPTNILVQRNPQLQAYLSDFGYVQRASDRELILIGTRAYMHPSLRKGWEHLTTSVNRHSGVVGKIGTSIDLYSLGVVLLEMLDSSASTPVSTEIDQIEKAASDAARSVFPANEEYQIELKEIIQKLLTIPISLETYLSCDLPSVFRRLSEQATKGLEREAQNSKIPPVVEVKGVLRRLQEAAESLTRLTAEFVVTPDKTKLIQPSDLITRKAEAVFTEMQARNKRTFFLAVGMTVTAFALITGLIFTAVLTGIFTEKDGWAIAFGGAGAITAIGTLLWKPFDRIYRANILSNHMEFISIRTLTVLQRAWSIDEQRQAFDDALKELTLLFERHGGNIVSHDKDSK